MNEVVKYHNDLNTKPLQAWTEVEMNILFAVVAKIRNKSTTQVVFTFDELKRLSNYSTNSKKSNAEFVDRLFDVSEKLSALSYTERSANGLKGKIIPMFKEFDIDGEETKTLVVQVSPHFERLFNKFGIHFTSFELLEFVTISSAYAKTAYRSLKQFRTKGWWQVTLEDFKLLLDIPEGYKSGNIDQRVLKVILSQLGGSDDTAIFKNLRVEKIKKKGRGRGGVLTGYKFIFDKEITGEWIDGKYDESIAAVKPARKTKTEPIPEWVDKESTAETPLTPEQQQEIAERYTKLPSRQRKSEN
mgnify:CR=1 FL=1